MIAYKLFRKRKDGSLSSLFINRKRKLPLNEWMECEDHPTKGFTHQPYWHCTSKPKAPHLSMKNREWYMVEIDNYKEINRPKNQGGKWLLAKKIKIIDKVKVGV